MSEYNADDVVYATDPEESGEVSTGTGEEYDEPYHDPNWLHTQYHALGKNQREIADEVGVGQNTISRHMDKNDIPTRELDEVASRGQGGHEKLFDKEWLRETYEDGNSLKEIAEELGVGETSVRRAFDRHDIETRSLSEALKLRNGKEYGDEEYRRKEWLEHEYCVLMKGSGQIAKENGWTSKTVREWLHRHDIPVRSRKAAQLLKNKREKCVPVTGDDTRDVVTAGTGFDHKWRDLKDREQGCLVPYRDKSWLEARIADGLNLREIVEICPSDVHHSTIRQWIDRFGIEYPPEPDDE